MSKEMSLGNGLTYNRCMSKFNTQIECGECVFMYHKASDSLVNVDYVNDMRRPFYK